MKVRIEVFLCVALVVLPACSEDNHRPPSRPTEHDAVGSIQPLAASPQISPSKDRSNELLGDRTVVFEIAGMEFVNPSEKRPIHTGEFVAAANDYSNVYLESKDGTSSRPLFARTDVGELMEKLSEMNKDKGEDKEVLLWAYDPFPVQEGRQIVFVTNKDSILHQQQGGYDIHIVNADGTGEKVLVHGAEYGNISGILDTTDDVVIAYGNDSLIAVHLRTGEVKVFWTAAILDALSKDGAFVLFRKIKDSYVQSELFVMNLHTGEEKKVGDAATDYYFNHGRK